MKWRSNFPFGAGLSRIKAPGIEGWARGRLAFEPLLHHFIVDTSSHAIIGTTSRWGEVLLSAQHYLQRGREMNQQSNLRVTEDWKSDWIDSLAKGYGCGDIVGRVR